MKLLRNPEAALPQIVRRLTEIEINKLPHSVDLPKSIFCGRSHDNSPTLIDFRGIQYREAQWKSRKLTNKEPNNCVILEDSSVVIIRNFVDCDSNPFIIGEKFSRVENFYNSPIQSGCIGTVVVSNFGTFRA